MENKINITNYEEYVDLVRKFATLVEKQIDLYEESMVQYKDQNFASQMPAIISLVNTVGYLRGQDGMFLDLRPSGDKQNELYALEDYFESRLKKLINHWTSSSEVKEYYCKILQSYFVESRTSQTVSVIC